jgi:DNA-binding NtrC family response regulator
MREKPLILLADDDSSLSRALHLSLGSIFDVHTVSTVAQAKAVASRNEYDIAVIDLNFEGQDLDGVNLIDHMSKESPGTFLVVLSGDRSVQRVVQAMRRKLFEFVHKEGDFFDSLLAKLLVAQQRQLQEFR